jgi:outer membrane biosynthesis protein TonB
MRESNWVPKVLLAIAALVSVLVLMRGLRKSDPQYGAVETRGVELKRLPSAAEQRAIDAKLDQVSGLDLTPKVAIREADPLPPAPPPAPPPPAPQQPQPAYTPPPEPPAEPEKKPFNRPQLRPRGLPTERTSNASTSAFLENAPKAETRTDSASAPAAPASAPSGGPRVFRDTTGKAVLRD